MQPHLIPSFIYHKYSSEQTETHKIALHIMTINMHDTIFHACAIYDTLKYMWIWIYGSVQRTQYTHTW